MTTITLPTDDGRLEPYTLRGPGSFTPAAPGETLPRIAYSAAHVVADARAAIDRPWCRPWELPGRGRQRTT